MINYLPTFNQLEPDNLFGLTMGYVISQLPVDKENITTVTKNDKDFIENGILCYINDEGKIVDWTGAAANADAETGKQVFIHFTEELNTILDPRKYFAVPVEEDDTYIRLVALVPGSEFTTNQTYTADQKAHFVVEDSTLPDGRAASRYIYIG